VVGETGGGRTGEEGRRCHATSTAAPVRSAAAAAAAGMGDSGGSILSVDVERISFGGKVRASLLPPIPFFPAAVDFCSP